MYCSKTCSWQGWSKENPDRIAAGKLRALERNPHKSRDYYWRNLEKSRAGKAASQRRRRARLRSQSAFKILPRDLRRMLQRYRNACAFCGIGFGVADLQWDHVVPLARGGSDGIGNLLPACRKCNQAKHNKLVIEWRTSSIRRLRLDALRFGGHPST